MRKILSRCALTALASLSLLMTLALSAPATAQVTRVSNLSLQERGQYVDGVLKTLIQSQNSFGTQQLPAVPKEQVSPQMQEAVRYIRAFANETQQLINELRYEERFSSYVRALLGDALSVKAKAEVLVNRSQGLNDVRALATEYGELDQQWRTLAYHLENTPNLNNNVRERVKRLNRGNEAIEKQLKMTPQVSRNDLIYHFAALGENFSNLGEDVRIDLYSHPQRDNFANQLTQLKSSAQQLRLATEYNHPHADIVVYYRQFHEGWLRLKGDLRTINNRYIQRNISRISQINDQIHEQLWLPPVIDGQDILYQATSLQQQIQQTGDNVTMRQLIEQPNAGEIFSKSQEFYALCNRFKRTVETQTQLESLKWDFRELDVAWTDLKAIMNPLQTNDTIQNVAAIENTVGGLRHSLGLDVGYGQQNQSYELAASLGNMSDLLYRDVNRYVANGQFSSQFRDESLHFADQFRQSARRFQDSITKKASAQQLRQDSRALAQQWNDLQNSLAKIPYQQRGELSRSTQQIGPVMAKLQLLYTY